MLVSQFSSVALSCPTLCDPLNRSTPGLPVHHQLPEFTQTHIHRVCDAIQPSHPLRPLLLLPQIPPSIRVFSNESTLRMRWPKYWSFSFSIISSKGHPGLISFRMDWLDLLAVQGTLKSLLQHHSSKASILRRSDVSFYCTTIESAIGIHISPLFFGFPSYLGHHRALYTIPCATQLVLISDLFYILVTQMVKNPPAMQKTWVLSLGQEDSLKEGMASHSSILAWRIPMDRGAWQAASPWGHKELDRTEWQIHSTHINSVCMSISQFMALLFLFGIHTFVLSISISI